MPRALLRRLATMGVELSEEAVRPALVHASALSEHPELASNERLEFLGDSVLELAIAEHLYHTYSEWDEGALSKLRGVVVSRPVLAEVGRGLALGEHLVLGRGEEQSGGRERPSILAAAVEALIGVVFLHVGYGETRRLVVELLAEEIHRASQEQSEDYKSLLQELGHRRFGEPPAYRTMEAEGPEHRKVFTVEAELGGVHVLGRGRSKKEAEQAAAKRLYVRLDKEETADQRQDST
ncbi:MAG: ribonuclease III [Candidatus Bipolaricaulota bacterium]